MKACRALFLDWYLTEMRLSFFLIGTMALTLSACGRDSGRRGDATVPDSAGWRSASAGGGRIRLRYRDSLMLGVVDRWTETCAGTVPVSAQDTLLEGRVVIAAADSTAFDSVAAVLGFQRRPDGWWIDPMDGGWSGGVQADTFSVGAWRGLYAEVSMKFIPEDQPPADEGQRVSEGELVQSRFVGIGPRLDRCPVALLWWGWNRPGPLTSDDTLGRATARQLLSTVQVVNGT